MVAEMATLGPLVSGYLTVLSRPIAIQALGVGIMIIVRWLAFAEIERADEQAQLREIEMQLRFHAEDQARFASQEAFAYHRAAEEFARIEEFRRSPRGKAGRLEPLDRQGLPPPHLEGAYYLRVRNLRPADQVTLNLRHLMNFVLQLLQDGSASGPRIAQLAQTFADVDRLTNEVIAATQASLTSSGADGSGALAARRERALEAIRRFGTTVPPLRRLQLALLAFAQGLLGPQTTPSGVSEPWAQPWTSRSSGEARSPGAGQPVDWVSPPQGESLDRQERAGDPWNWQDQR
jgi:hypothetical protein